MSNNKSTRRQNKPSYKANIKPLQKDLNTGEQKNKNQIVQTNSRFMLTDFLPTTKKEVVMLNTSLGFCAILLLFVLSLNGGRLGWFYVIGLIATLSTICNEV